MKKMNSIYVDLIERDFILFGSFSAKVMGVLFFVVMLVLTIGIPTTTIAQTMTVCGPAPAGFVTIEILGTCSGTTTTIRRKVINYQNLPVGTELSVCGDNPPPGWVTLSLTTCAKVNSTSYTGRRIKRIDTMPAGTVLNICGMSPPPGWASTAVIQRCSVIGVTSYTGYTIIKLDGMPANSVVTLCNDSPPVGWVVTSISKCSVSGVNSYLSKTIRKVEGLPTNAVVDICGDQVIPANWVVSAVTGVCVKVDNTSYTGRRIRNISGLPPGSSVEICGTVAPSGWVCTRINGPCASVNLTSYLGRTITRHSGLPIGSTLQICGDSNPAGWTSITPNTTCAKIGVTSYSGRTIRKVSEVTAREATKSQPEFSTTETNEMLLDVFPNPTTDVVTIAYAPPAQGKASVDLVDINGKSVTILSDAILDAEKRSLTVDLSSFPKGIYTLVFITTHGRARKRIIKY